MRPSARSVDSANRTGAYRTMECERVNPRNPGAGGHGGAGGPRVPGNGRKGYGDCSARHLASLASPRWGGEKERAMRPPQDPSGLARKGTRQKRGTKRQPGVRGERGDSDQEPGQGRGPASRAQAKPTGPLERHNPPNETPDAGALQAASAGRQGQDRTRREKCGTGRKAARQAIMGRGRGCARRSAAGALAEGRGAAGTPTSHRIVARR